MKATSIAAVRGRRVWDSRGRPTVEAEVTLAGGATGRAIAPAGASRGSGEAVDLRDGGSRFGGLDVRRAVAMVEGPIAGALAGLDVAEPFAVDRVLVELDGTPDKSRLGGNATVAVSMAAAHAAASAHGLPLWRWLAGTAGTTPAIPLPEIQILGGGAHAGRRIDIQDFLVVCPDAADVAEALDRTAEVYRAAGELLAARGRLRGVADEGGFWPEFDSNEEGLETLVQAIERAGFVPGEQVAICLDVAASEFGRGGRYRLARDGRELDSDGLAGLLLDWIERYPIVSLEDPFAEDDPDAFARFRAALPRPVQLVGDDLLVTDAARVREAAASGRCSTVLLKPDQRGTLAETLEAWSAACEGGMGAIVSARSGESEDVTICHLAVGWGVPQIKVGSITRGERTAKWNELLRIAEATDLPFPGARGLAVGAGCGRAAAVRPSTPPHPRT